jgi:hypothetical protein
LKLARQYIIVDEAKKRTSTTIKPIKTSTFKFYFIDTTETEMFDING